MQSDTFPLGVVSRDEKSQSTLPRVWGISRQSRGLPLSFMRNDWLHNLAYGKKVGSEVV